MGDVSHRNGISAEWNTSIPNGMEYQHPQRNGSIYSHATLRHVAALKAPAAGALRA
jgi:hypothetical protein